MSDEQLPIDPRLRAALEELAHADGELGASADVAERLRSAVRAQRRDKRQQMAWLAAVAALLIAVTGARWYMRPSRALDTPQRAVIEAPAPDVVPADFLPLPYATVPVSSGQIVQIVVPAIAMASFGLDPSSAGGDAVNADVFVGEDGLARAIRFSPFPAKELVP